MVTFTSIKGRKKTIGLVLSAENLARLTNDEGIVVPGATFGQPDDEIVIFFAEAEEFIDDLAVQGFINEATQMLYTGRREKRS